MSSPLTQFSLDSLLDIIPVFVAFSQFSAWNSQFNSLSTDFSTFLTPGTPFQRVSTPHFRRKGQCPHHTCSQAFCRLEVRAAGTGRQVDHQGFLRQPFQHSFIQHQRRDGVEDHRGCLCRSPGAVPSARQRIPASLPAPGSRTVWRRRSHPSPGHAAVAQAPCRSCRSRSPALPCRAASGRSLPWRSGWRPPQTARHSPGRVPPGGDSPPPPVPGIPATEECRRTLRPAPAPRACRAPPASPAGAPPFRTVPGQLFRPDSPEQAHQNVIRRHFLQRFRTVQPGLRRKSQRPYVCPGLLPQPPGGVLLPQVSACHKNHIVGCHSFSLRSAFLRFSTVKK